MPKLIALWSKPADPDAFDQDYLATHIPLVEQLPGVTIETAGKVLDGPYHRVAVLAWSSMEEFGGAFGGEPGAALLQDTSRLQETHGVEVQTLVVE